MKVPDALVDKFGKGTVPYGKATDGGLDAIKGFLSPTIEWIQEDCGNGVFENFNEYTTSVNVTLKNVEDSIAFNLFHEGSHLGVVLPLEKIVSAKA